MATMKDVAQRAGVSIATVSHVLNGSKPVSAAYSRRVLKAAEALRYFPNRSARALRKGYSQVIGLLFPDLRNSFFSEIVYAVEQEARNLGYGLIFVNTSGSPEQEEEGFSWLVEHQVAGAIWIPASSKSPKQPFPIVAVDRPVAGFDQVFSDHCQGGKLIATHAYELGHRKVALLSGPKQISSARLRRRGFLDGARGRLHVEWEALASFEGEISPAGIERLKSSCATFIFAANDLIAMSCIRLLVEAGIKVPEDVSVAGYDDVPWAQWISPSLTTVHQDIASVGRNAVQTWVEGLENPDRPPVRRVIPVELVLGESTRRLNGASS